MKHDWVDLSTELLPQVLQDFVRLIGLHATMILVEHFGGRRLYIPVNATPEHRLAKLIGLENLAALSRVYGLEDHFDIPKAKRALLALRNDKIRAEFGPKSASQLALEHDLTERQIFSIVATGEQVNADQVQLFG